LPNRIKVSTAETWSTWLLNPEIGQYVDFITIHLLPYWEGVPVKGSLGSLQRFYDDVQDEFPDKPIVIGEVRLAVGGPHAQGRRSARSPTGLFHPQFRPARARQGLRLLPRSKPTTSPGKAATKARSAPIGACSTPTAIRNSQFTGMLRSFPAWRSYASARRFSVFCLGLLILGRMPRVRQPGYLVMGALVGLVTTGLLVLLDASTLEYIQPSDIAMTWR
jgi:hypothetical protein